MNFYIFQTSQVILAFTILRNIKFIQFDFQH